MDGVLITAVNWLQDTEQASGNLFASPFHLENGHEYAFYVANMFPLKQKLPPLACQNLCIKNEWELLQLIIQDWLGGNGKRYKFSGRAPWENEVNHLLEGSPADYQMSPGDYFRPAFFSYTEKFNQLWHPGGMRAGTDGLKESCSLEKSAATPRASRTVNRICQRPRWQFGPAEPSIHRSGHYCLWLPLSISYTANQLLALINAGKSGRKDWGKKFGL